MPLAATGGYTSEGMARYNQNERAIQQRDQQAIQDYRQNQNQNYQAMQEMHQRNAEIAHHRGNTLQGTTDYRDPSTGNTYNLPHTNLPNSYYNPNTGDTFYGNPQGNYQRQGMDGYSYDLEEDE